MGTKAFAFVGYSIVDHEIVELVIHSNRGNMTKHTKQPSGDARLVPLVGSKMHLITKSPQGSPIMVAVSDSKQGVVGAGRVYEKGREDTKKKPSAKVGPNTKQGLFSNPHDL